MKKCLVCYQPLEGSAYDGDYHYYCSKKIFGSEYAPEINFGIDEIEDLAKKSINQHLGVTGVQPKISLNISKRDNDPKHRIMIVDFLGNFILKPPSHQFPDMSVVEDATMHMAQIAGLVAARHCLIKLKSGELAYVTRRFDRGKKSKKIAVEDFCQLSEILTESKYDTSLEKAGKIILKYSAQPGLDAVTFFDLNIFCFLTGNADMHLKNFSLMQNDAGEMVLSPAYDLISTKLMPIDDKEEVALTVNGKKAKIKRGDFFALGKNLQIPEKVIENSFARLLTPIPAMKKIIRNSFMSIELKKSYNKLLDERAKILE